MKKDVSISVVLPAYNESGNIEKTVTQAVSYLKKTFKDYEVIVVNDGSVDGTPEIVEKLALSNPKIVLINHLKNLGYGSALRSGFEKASLDYVFLMDSDGQFDISDIDRFLPFIEDYDILIGYRKKRVDPFIRSLNTWLYHLFIRLLFGLKVKDIDCAFKMFPRSAYYAVKPIKSGGALFSAEFLIKLKQKGFTIREVPVRHFPRRFGKQTGANLGVILRMFKECWKLRGEIRGSKETQGGLNGFFLTLLAFGLILRVFLSPYWTFEGDFEAWKGWASGVSEVGFSEFYNKYWCDYMPGYIYVLWLLNHIHSAFPRLPDKILFKLPANLSDLGISILIFFILRKITDIKSAKLASLVYFFNPASLSNSTFWGQADSVHALPLLLSIVLGLQQSFVASGVFAALAFMIKPQSFVIFPIVGLFIVRRFFEKEKENIFSLKNLVFLFGILVAVFATVFFVSLPFMLDNMAKEEIGGIFKEPFYFIKDRFNVAYDQYKYTSLNAFNLWGMFAMWKSDQIRFLGITYQRWGTAFFGAFYALIVGFLFYFGVIKRSVKSKEFTTLTFYAVMLIFCTLFLFVTRAHERHFLPTIVFFTLIAFRSGIYWFFYALISLVYVVNLFYAYIVHYSIRGFSSSLIDPYIPGMVVLLLIVFLVVLTDFIRNSVGLYRGEQAFKGR